jgi:hypothetical protein
MGLSFAATAGAADTSRCCNAASPYIYPALANVGQNAVAGKGATVRIRGRKGTRVRIDLSSRSFDEGTRRLAAPKVVRLRRSGNNVVRIRATRSGRRSAGSCSARTVIARFTSGKRRKTVRKAMVRQRAACRVLPVDLSKKADCDFIAQPKEGMCMMPFPNDYYTRSDASSPTGKRIDFTAGGMPANRQGVRIDPASYLDSDGFSQGQGIILKVPGLDTPEALAANDFVGLADLGRYSEPNQKAVVIDAKTGKRWPIWVQIDSNASTPRDTALMISPATNFDEKGRYIVALRNLKGADGKTLQAPDAFRYYRDQIRSNQSAVNQRRQHFEGIFRTLRKAKIKRSDLYLAWDFTVASDENNYRRALYMRDEAFETLGDTTMADNIVQGTAPAFTVTPGQVTDINGPNIKRRIRGTYTVPCFLTNGCQPGGVMDLDENGLPQRNGNYQAKFTCTIPQVGLAGPAPPKLRPYIFGHGLVGTGDQVQGSINPNLIQEHAMIACGTDEIGMASEDLGSIAAALTELSDFDVVPDRLQQGLINELFLARLMYHPGGLGTVPAFQNGDGFTAGDSVIRNDHVYYMGASQGGIMGGPLTAISPDFTQSALVVGAMNYSTLLNRSTDWPAYGIVMNSAYPEQLSRPLLFNLIQMLWDRGEPNGYAHRMTDNPPPNTPEHKIMLHVALGDHQVSNYASDVEARTAGLYTPVGGVSEERWPGYNELWNVPRIQSEDYPFTGSSVVYWDGGPFRKNPANLAQNIGTGTPPIPNLAPTSLWEDPHGAPRGAPGPVAMIDTFFSPSGYIEDYCGGEPCLASDWDGNFANIIPVD